MNYETILVGVFFCCASVFFLKRSLSPQPAEGKLKAMLEMWGMNKGLWLYRFCYFGIPFFLGALLLRAGYLGQSLGQFFSV